MEILALLHILLVVESSSFLFTSWKCILIFHGGKYESVESSQYFLPFLYPSVGLDSSQSLYHSINLAAL